MLHSRMKRVEGQYQLELAKILAYDLDDPRVQFVSVTAVKVSNDLREAVVHVSLLEDDHRKGREALEGLESARGYIKRLLAERLRLKRLPDPHFKLDTTQRDAFHLFRVIEEVQQKPSAAIDEAPAVGEKETAGTE